MMEACIRVTYFDLKININKQDKCSDLLLRLAIKLCENVEILENDNFQISFQKLRNSQDQAFRVLSEHGQSLSIREIHREIARRLASVGEAIPGRRSISNVLSNDDRFTAIGKSVWALSEWEDVNQSTIIEIMKEFFYIHNKPAKPKEIYEYCRKKRPLSENSITIYLSTRTEFTRVSPGLYGLAEWSHRTPSTKNSKDSKAGWTISQVNSLVVEIFNKHQTNVMAASDLVNEIIKITHIKTDIYSRLRRCPSVRLIVVSESPRRLQAILLSESEVEVDLSIREQIEISVREILKKQLEYTMPLFELRDKITTRGNIRPHTFYRYLSEMPDIQKSIIKSPKSVLVTLISDDLDKDIADMWDDRFIYDIAISYAGKERDYAENLTYLLRTKGHKVFYDRNQLPDLIGRNLQDALLKIYRDKAYLCVILGSSAYNESIFAQHERQSAQDRQRRDPGYIVLVKLEDVPIEGFYSSTAYLSWQQHGIDVILDVTEKQLQKQKKK